jgi:type II restriction/modification system DNA methylase subunit YeeA
LAYGILKPVLYSTYEMPFVHVVEHVKPARIKNNRKARAEKWWRHGEARPGMRRALVGLSRYIVTVETAKHRIFTSLPIMVAPEHRLIVFPHHDDATLGILSSRFHIAWTLAQGGTLEDRPVYNSTRCFETFPFPKGLTLNLAPADYTNPAAVEIATAAQALNKLRENWLNPPEWTDWVRTHEEEKAGYPPRPVAKLGFESYLKKRTLTNLYNARPAWLDNAHKALDAAVAQAYGWSDYTPEMPDEEILRRLLELNLARSAL